MVTTGQNNSVDVESKLGVFEFRHAIVLATKILIAGPVSVIGRIKDGFDLDNVCGTKMAKQASRV